MVKKNKIKGNIKIYKKEMKKWESRIHISLIFILVGIISFFLFYLKINNWNISNIDFDTKKLYNLNIFSPVVFYLVFSTRQFNYFKKLFVLYRQKNTEL